MLNKCGGVARARRFALARWSASEAPVLVRLAVRQIEIARRAGLLPALFDAFLGMTNAVGEFAAVGHPERPRRARGHIGFVQRFDPQIDRARETVDFVGLDNGRPVELEMPGHPRLARPSDQPGNREVGY